MNPREFLLYRSKLIPPPVFGFGRSEKNKLSFSSLCRYIYLRIVSLFLSDLPNPSTGGGISLDLYRRNSLGFTPSICQNNCQVTFILSGQSVKKIRVLYMKSKPYKGQGRAERTYILLLLMYGPSFYINIQLRNHTYSKALLKRNNVQVSGLPKGLCYNKK